MNIPNLFMAFTIFLALFSVVDEQKEKETVWKTTETPISMWCVKHKDKVFIYKYREYPPTKKFRHIRRTAECPGHFSIN